MVWKSSDHYFYVYTAGEGSALQINTTSWELQWTLKELPSISSGLFDLRAIYVTQVYTSHYSLLYYIHRTHLYLPTMAKKPIKADDIIDAVQDPKILDLLMNNLTQYLTPLIEMIVEKMSAKLSEAFEKMVDQKIALGRN